MKKVKEIKPFIYMTYDREEGQLIRNKTLQCCNSDHIQ